MGKTEADDDYGEGPLFDSLSALIRDVTASIRDGLSLMHGLTASIHDERLGWRDARDEGPSL